MNKKQVNSNLIFFPLLTIGFILLYMAGTFFLHNSRQHFSNPPALKLAPKDEPLMTGFQFTEYYKGTKDFALNAERFYLRNKKVKYFDFRIAIGKSIEMEGVEVTFYKANKPVSHLYSNAAIMDANKKNIVFQGKPVLFTEDRRTLSAREIFWNNSEKRLSAEGGCILGADGKRQSGDAINADVELKNFIVTDKKIIGLY